MRVKKCSSIVLVATIVSLTALLGRQPTAAGAWSCPLEYLASGPVYNGTNQQGTVYLIKNDCDGNIFGRVSTPDWQVFGWSTLQDGSTTVANSPSNVYLWWGGHVDTSEVKPISGHVYSAFGEIDPLSFGPSYSGQTVAWTAP